MKVSRLKHNNQTDIHLSRWCSLCQPIVTFQNATKVCKSSKGNQFPDVLIDLTFNRTLVCLLGHLARQLDCGIITVDASNCVPFSVQQSGFMNKDLMPQAGIPSLRYPFMASLVALTTYTSLLHNVFHTGSMFVLGMNESKFDFPLCIFTPLVSSVINFSSQ